MREEHVEPKCFTRNAKTQARCATLNNPRSMCHFRLGQQSRARKNLAARSAVTLIASTNSRQFNAFLMDSKLNIVLHDAPTPCIAVGELLVESVLAATSFFLSSTAFRISHAIQALR